MEVGLGSQGCVQGEMGSKFTIGILRNLNCIFGLRIAVSKESLPSLIRTTACCLAYTRYGSPMYIHVI